LSNSYTPGPNDGPSNNGHSLVNRREMHASHMTGALPIIKTPERSAITGFDFEQMIESLHELFEHDRQIASQQDSTRCGLCYLHFVVSELHYHEEEGFYVCQNCERLLGKHKIPMLRQQQKL
jgi:hypothetical protein